MKTRGPIDRLAPAGRREHSTALESLRGIAIALVMLTHADNMLGGNGVVIGHGWLDPLLAYVDSGHTGVTLFFALSAFLLSRPFLAELRGGPRPSLSHFAARRALRILPMYWVAVGISVLLNPSVADWRDALGYAVFLQSFEGLVTPIHFYSNPWWSLATEVQFYIALPLLAQLMRTRSGSILCAVLALVYAIAYARMVRAGFIPGSLLAGSLFGRAHVFGLGILAAWIHDAHGETIRSWCERRTWLRNGGADALLLGLLLALGLLLQAVSLSVFASETEWHAWHVVEGALWTGVLLVVLLAPLRLRSAIDNRLLRALGRISYSVYLTHFPVLFLALFSLAPGEGWTYHGTGVALLGFGITLGLSTLTYRYIERPFLERKVRLAPT